MAMSDYSLSDLAAVTEGGGGSRGGYGFGADGGLWILLLFIILGGGRFGYGGYGGGGGSGAGSGQVGGNELYPWLNQAQTSWQGISDIQQQLCNCCSDMQQTMSNGFANLEASNNTRQMANMQQSFANQMATIQGFNGLQSTFADCCCENRLAIANQTAALLAEHCADRNALQMGVRDILQNTDRNGQMIMDKLCQLELDGIRGQLEESRRENDRLRQDNIITKLDASQIAQTAQISAGQINAVDSLYNRLQNCPIQTEPIYGRQPIFTCQPNNNGCGCGCGCAA